MARRVPSLTLITQNVDGLHSRAGSPQVIELHGSLLRVKCFDEGRTVDGWQETGQMPPRCPFCDGYLRPDVVWFGENLPAQALQAAFDASLSCEVFISIGTSGLVEPALLPNLAHQEGAVLVSQPARYSLTCQADFLKCLAGDPPALVRAVET
jgi:NAD-dependent deacetylase